jgi:hypothetical protein
MRTLRVEKFTADDLIKTGRNFYPGSSRGRQDSACGLRLWILRQEGYNGAVLPAVYNTEQAAELWGDLVIRYLLSVFFLCSSIVASAAELQGQGYGLGMKSCAQFAGDYKAEPTVAEDLYFAWAEGFMSGLNLSATANNLRARHLADIDMESAKLQIRSYCDGHPLAQYVSAVLTIYTGLPDLPTKSK